MGEAKNKKIKNEVINKKVYPHTNAILFILFFTITLVTLPFLYWKHDIVVARIFLVLMFVAVVIGKRVASSYKKSPDKESFILDCLVSFSDKASIFAYLLAAFGYMYDMVEKCVFIFVFLVFLLAYLIFLFLYVIAPIFNRRNSRSYTRKFHKPK